MIPGLSIPMLAAARTLRRAAKNFFVPLDQCTSSQPQQPQLVRYLQGFSRITEPEKGQAKFTGYYPAGFYINNVQVPGSVLAYGDLYMMWKPRTMDQITADSLAFLDIITPAPEVVVLGYGSTPTPVTKEVQDFLTSRGIKLELLDSRNATGYFNVLNEEGRVVVGALLALDSTAPLLEVMPEQKEQMWERAPMSQRSMF